MHEATAKKRYSDIYGATIKESGFVISTTHPFLGASPDGLVGDDIVLEVKCPYKVRDLEITPKTVPFLCDTGLKMSHSYYYQVQGQLFCTGRNEAHFCVYTFKDFKVFILKKDEEFIKKMVSDLTAFYHDHYRPALIEKRVYKDYASYFC